MPDITLNHAQSVVSQGRAAAEKAGMKAVFAVLDKGTNLVAFSRMDGAWLASNELAIAKARTSVMFQAPTEALRRGYLGPDAVGFDTSLTAYVAAMDKLRAAGVLRELQSEEVGRLYALRFGFEQLGQDIKDLVERSSDLARE